MCVCVCGGRRFFWRAALKFCQNSGKISSFSPSNGTVRKAGKQVLDGDDQMTANVKGFRVAPLPSRRLSALAAKPAGAAAGLCFPSVQHGPPTPCLSVWSLKLAQRGFIPLVGSSDIQKHTAPLTHT